MEVSRLRRRELTDISFGCLLLNGIVVFDGFTIGVKIPTGFFYNLVKGIFGVSIYIAQIKRQQNVVSAFLKAALLSFLYPSAMFAAIETAAR